MADQDYIKRFDPLCFIDRYLSKVGLGYKESLKMFRDVFLSHQKGAGLKVLDFGCGPSVIFQACTAPYADQVVFADYLPQNRQMVQLWLDGDSTAPDWNLFFEYAVVQLEGKEKEEV